MYVRWRHFFVRSMNDTFLPSHLPRTWLHPHALGLAASKLEGGCLQDLGMSWKRPLWRRLREGSPDHRRNNCPLPTQKVESVPDACHTLTEYAPAGDWKHRPSCLPMAPYWTLLSLSNCQWLILGPRFRRSRCISYVVR